MKHRNSRDADEIDMLCHRWAAWCRTRRLFGAPRATTGTLGRITSARGHHHEGEGARCSAALAAFHQAVLAQPDDTHDQRMRRVIFLAYYVQHVVGVASHAEGLGISRATWYRHLDDFRSAAYRAHLDILRSNLAHGASLAHAPQIQHMHDA